MRAIAQSTGSFLLALALAGLLAPSSAAQDDGFLVEFNFETLRFTLYPSGLGGSAGAQGGSGLQAFAHNVSVVDLDAVDLRHCIDGFGFPECSYGEMLSQFNMGDKDGQVEPDEVDRFESVAVLGVGQIQKVQNLSAMLENNVTVDGFNGEGSRVVAMAVRGAEGDTNSSETAYVDVTIEVGYANDAQAKRHEIHLQTMHLKKEGFVYEQVVWLVQSDADWVYRPSQTEPLSFQTKVTKQGWTSTQTEFERATQNGLRLVAEKEEKKKSPGAGAFLLAVALVGVAVAVRRRR